MSTSALATATDQTPELDSLRAQLLEKDELVGLLTDRLEQAVSRLDHLKRAGVKTQPATTGGGIAPEIERLVQEWDEAALPAATDRIEQQLLAMQQAILDRLDSVETSAATVSRLHTPATSPDDARNEPAAPPREPMEKRSSNGIDWEAMKASLMSGAEDSGGSEDPAPTAEDRLPEPPDDEDDVVLEVPEEPIASVVPRQDDVPEVDPLPLSPEAIDTDVADRDTLAEAVRERDAYIVALTQRALDRRVKLEIPTDWALLRGTPGELVKNVQRLHDELNDAVRMAEVQLCLERAKLSRERTELEAAKAELAAPEEAEQPTETVKERRWRRMLGR